MKKSHISVQCPHCGGTDLIYDVLEEFEECKTCGVAWKYVWIPIEIRIEKGKG